MYKCIAEYDDIATYSKEYNKIKIPVKGDCLEGADIFDGDIVIVDLTKKPLPEVKGKPTDIALVADKRLGTYGEIAVGVKGFVGLWMGKQFVCTHYAKNKDDYKLDAMFPVEHILGVVYACLDPTGALRWKRDISEHPASLSLEPVILGGEVQPLKAVDKNEL